MKDWLTFIIVALIIIILVDGVRRMRLARRDKIRVSPRVYKQTANRDDTSKNELYPSELPNGGARVVAHRDTAKPVKKIPSSSHRDARKPQQTSLNLDEAVPMLMESVSDDLLAPEATPSARSSASIMAPASHATTSVHSYVDDERISEDERIEPTFSTEAFSASEASLIEADDDYASNDYSASTQINSSPRVADNTLAADTEFFADADLQLDEDEDENEDDEYYTNDNYDDDRLDPSDDEDDYGDKDDDIDDYDEEVTSAQRLETPSVTSERPDTAPEEVLIINVMAGRTGNFNGEELLAVLLESGLRFGDMDIFHRYSDSKGEGALLFSIANMVKPGTFDLDAMEEFETPGISMFMTLPLKADSMQSFELMVDTARTIAENLNGELKDEQRSVMTRQTIEHCRERIRDFERRRLFTKRQH